MVPKSEDSYGKWRQAARRIERSIRRGRPGNAWRQLERIVAVEPLAADPLELGFLRRAVSLLSAYGEVFRAEQLVHAHEARRRLSGELAKDVEMQYRVLRLIVALQSRHYDEAFRQEAEIAWEGISSVPWVFTARLALAYQRGDRREILELLRRPSPRVPSPPGRLEPYDRGTVFRILAEFYFYQADLDRARRYSKLALRELGKDACVDSQIARLLMEGTWGGRLMLDGRFEEAEAYLEHAMAETQRFGNATLAAHFATELARTRAEWGHTEPARRLILSAIDGLRRARSNRHRDFYLTGAYLLAACIESAAEDPAKARRYFSRAEKLLARSDHRRLRGELHLVRGHCCGMQRTPACRGRALEDLELAAKHFAARGVDDPLANLMVHIARGQLHLRWGQRDLALQEAVAALARLGASRPRAYFAHVVHFQSQILASGQLPGGDQLYEEILRNLGTVTSPIRLFKIISNLYFYTWDRDEHLDLSVHHLRQVNRMAEVLDRETFQDLYERHVNRRVMRRMMVKTFGVEPDTVEEPA